MTERIGRGIFSDTEYRRDPRFPELPLAGFGFLTNFVWEILQVPWFTGMAEASHGSVIGLCIRATGGDIRILLASFWLSSIICGHRQWLLKGEQKPAGILIITALVVTIILEWLAPGPLERWAYTDSMPMIPLLGVGLSPLLQWLLLPPLIMWLTRRHMLSHNAFRSYGSGEPPRNIRGQTR